MVGRGAGKTGLSVVLCIGKSWLGLGSPNRGRDGLGSQLGLSRPAVRSVLFSSPQ